MLKHRLSQMTTKDIPVRADLVEQLKEERRINETWSDLVERLAGEAGIEITEDDGTTIEAEQLAGEVMTAGDRLAAGDSARTYLRSEYDVDPANYNDAEQLREDLRAARQSKETQADE